MKHRLFVIAAIVGLMASLSQLYSPLPNLTSDHRANAQEAPMEFGDAPLTFPTLVADNGARHLDASAEWLGTVPTPPIGCVNTATVESDAAVVDLDNDDAVCQWWFNPINDNAFVELMVSIGPSAPVATRYLNVLIDRDQDGDWSGPDELAISNLELLLPPLACQFPVVLNLGAIPAFPFSAWVRFTLTRSPIAETPEWIGSGQFEFGETEDWFLTWDDPLPAGRGGPSPGAFCPVLGLRLTCSPKNRKLIHGNNVLNFNLFTTGNVRPNRLKVVNKFCGGCDPNAGWTSPLASFFASAVGVNVLGIVPPPQVTTSAVDQHPNGCIPGGECKMKLFAWYFNLDATVGPVGAAGSADTCPCVIVHPAVAANPKGGIKGNVVDNGGAPIPGVCISVIDQFGQSIMFYAKPNGKIKTGQKLIPGDYTALAEKDGFLPASKPLTVVPDANAKANFVLEKPGRIDGTVGLAGSFFDVFVEIEITGPNGKIFREPAESNGKFTTGPMLPAGNYIVTAMSPGFETQSDSILVQHGRTTIINVDLKRQATPALSLTAIPQLSQSGKAIQDKARAQ